ncbi:aromatase/cyclase [Actinomadura rugatobispora]|uniref:Aromatase/cyclase n=1 Tax=Actinomadura rugatobispora TaxID=1994 RepID=A0ABW0ZRC7_9ACTN|nr:SRPBCC family protein [Actinomadura rugatobispora]
MSDQIGVREVEHQTVVNAPAETVYRLVADVERWPRIFPPSVHAEYVEKGAARGSGDEVIRLWAVANGEPKTWTSRRRLDADALRVDFRQEVPARPVAAMGGAWLVERLSDRESRVRLLHDYRAVDDDPGSLQLIDTAVDRNSGSELAAIKDAAEAGTGAAGTFLTFEDTVTVDGPGRLVYDFLNEADQWTERLPHVAGIVLTEDSPGLQTLEMDTRAEDGSVHTTKSVRVCFPHDRIVYKQLRVPPLLTLHTGVWTVEEEPGRPTVVRSLHTVRVNEANIEAVLGAGADLDKAKSMVRSSIGGNSVATLNRAKRFAESGGRG